MERNNRNTRAMGITNQHLYSKLEQLERKVLTMENKMLSSDQQIAKVDERLSKVDERLDARLDTIEASMKVGRALTLAAIGLFGPVVTTTLIYVVQHFILRLP